MSSIRIIKRRIKSTQNIAKITKAMEMVAASKMKKSQTAALSGKPYAEMVYQATIELAMRTDRELHPLLNPGNPQGKILAILISSNKGLCGGLNTNLFRQLLTWFGKNKEIDYISLGKKGQNYIVRANNNLIADFSQKIPFTDNVSALTQVLVDGFIQGKYKEVYLIFNSFINAIKQIPIKKIILPLISLKPDSGQIQEENKLSEFLIEPTIDEVLDSLLPHYLENQVRAAIYESEASEHAARMIAMRNATDAAMDFMSELTLEFNKIRQEKITFEIADIVTARLAVEV